jgi:hypothetical protein
MKNSFFSVASVTVALLASASLAAADTADKAPVATDTTASSDTPDNADKKADPAAGTSTADVPAQGESEKGSTSDSTGGTDKTLPAISETSGSVSADASKNLAKDGNDSQTLGEGGRAESILGIGAAALAGAAVIVAARSQKK